LTAGSCRHIKLDNNCDSPSHNSHRSGLEVDLRPLRKDGLEQPVRWWEPQYDKEGTAQLIELFRTFAPVVTVLFNDPGILLAKRAVRHDDHFHLKLRG
jgi:penicillin-insensitive murein DD-endopeptidase